MTDHVGRRTTSASSQRIAELHKLCDADYAKGRQERASAAVAIAPYAAMAIAAAVPAVPEPTDLDVAISLAQKLLNSDEVSSMREALRLLLRALGAEPVPLCPAGRLVNLAPCDGPPVVTVLDAHNAGANACEYHGSRLLAALNGGRVYALPDAPDGAAIRVFKAAGAAGGER